MNIVENNIEKKSLIAGSLIFSILAYLYISSATSSINLRMVQLEELYGFVSIVLLFLAVIAGPLYRLYPDLKFKMTHFRMLGGLGISCFYFALLHSYVALFGLLQGFKGIAFLNTFETTAVIGGFLALLILAIMAGTSWDFLMKYLGPKWKLIHRFVYLAIGALVIHVLLIGADYTGFSNLYAIIPLLLFFIWLFFYAASMRKFLFMKIPETPQWQVTLLISIITLSIVFCFYQLHILVIGGHHH